MEILNADIIQDGYVIRSVDLIAENKDGYEYARCDEETSNSFDEKFKERFQDVLKNNEVISAYYFSFEFNKFSDNNKKIIYQRIYFPKKINESK